MATFYGSDSHCITDVGLVDVQITNPIQLIGERLACRLQTSRAGLASVDPDASDFGFDVRQLVNGKMTPAARATAKQQIRDEVYKDEQVISADVDVTLSAAGIITIVINGVSAVGPFKLTGNINSLTEANFFIS